MRTQTVSHPRGAEFIHALVASCERKRYFAKAAIIAQGDVCQDLYFVIKGTASLRLRTPSNHDLVLALIHGGEFFGETGLFEADARCPAAVRAKTACEVARISHTRLRASPALFTGLMPLLAPQLARQLDVLQRKTAEMAFYDLETRLTTALRYLASGPDAYFHPEGKAIAVTRTELAAMTGASREMVGRLLIRMHKRGIVRAKGSSMIVLDYVRPRVVEVPRPSKYVSTTAASMRL